MSAWTEQWDRVLRWYERFGQINEGLPHVDATDYLQDEVYAFFQNCYHFKDWLKNDESVPMNAREAVEEFAVGTKDDRGKGNRHLQVCADLANGSKHLTLIQYKLDPNTRISKRDFNFDLSSNRIVAKYEVIGDGQVQDAHALATECTAAWRKFLKDQRLLVPDALHGY